MLLEKNNWNKKEVFVLISLSILTGLLGFSFLALVNHMVSLLLSGKYLSLEFIYILLFSVIILLYVWVKQSFSIKMMRFSQKLFWDLRNSIVSTVLKSSYENVINNKVKILSAVQQDVYLLTNASIGFIHFATSIIIVFASLVYMAFKDLPLFFATSTTALIGITLYTISSKRNNKHFEKARDLENNFLYNFNSIISGFKEIQIEPLKGEGIFRRKIKEISVKSFLNNSRAYINFINIQMISQVLFYILISSILVVFSIIFKIPNEVLISFLFIILYITGAIETIMVLLPDMIKASVSYKRLKTLQSDLLNNSTQYKNHLYFVKCKIENFNFIRIENLYFTYSSKDENSSFVMGPLNFFIKKGDIVFIYGNNGSGKTTFIHSLLGILKSKDAKINFNDEVLNENNYFAYKALFSVVFNDFHLFDEFYGNESFNQEKARDLIKLFELDDKVCIEKTGFSTISLSTGQRKRLAFISAILEEKPVIILDEWAADQDPYFRKKFYMEVLPILKNDGFTIIAITHDDKYYHCADEIYRMDGGKLNNETRLFNE